MRFALRRNPCYRLALSHGARDVVRRSARDFPGAARPGRVGSALLQSHARGLGRPPERRAPSPAGLAFPKAHGGDAVLDDAADSALARLGSYSDWQRDCAERARALIDRIDGYPSERMEAFLTAHGHDSTFEDFAASERAIRDRALSELCQVEPMARLDNGWRRSLEGTTQEWQARIRFGGVRDKVRLASVMDVLNRDKARMASIIGALDRSATEADLVRRQIATAEQSARMYQQSMAYGFNPEGLVDQLNLSSRQVPVFDAMRVLAQNLSKSIDAQAAWQSKVDLAWGRVPDEWRTTQIQVARTMDRSRAHGRTLAAISKPVSGSGAPLVGLGGADSRALAVRQTAQDVRATAVRDESPEISLRRTALQAQAKLQARVQRSLDPISALRQRGVIDESEYDLLKDAFLVELLAELPPSNNSNIIPGQDAASDNLRDSEVSQDIQETARGRDRKRQQTEAAREKRAQSKQAYLDRIADDKRKGVNIMARDYSSCLGIELGLTPAYVRELRSEFLKGYEPS